MKSIQELTETLSNLDDNKFRDVIKSACYARTRQLNSRNNTAEVVIECLHDLCNGSGNQVKAAWWEIWRKEHPTIRQTVALTFVELLKTWVHEFTKGGWQPDARDKATYELATFLSQQDIHFPHI